MQKYKTAVRTALLSSAFAIAALAPAIGAPAHTADQKRLLALQGTLGEPAHAAPQVHAGDAFGRRAAKSTYTVLYEFLGGNDGSGSGANVSFDSAGNLYGTTDFGGAGLDGDVYKLAPDGTESVLHTFTGSDGAQPDGAVIVMSNGDLIGSTTSGGTSDNGTLFSLSAKGKLKTLYSLSSTDGSEVRGNLLQDKSGNLYGTALFSGANGYGTVFEYAADGTFTVLHAFEGTDGEYPEHGLVADQAGDLFGVTAFGGTSGEGTVFEITTKGKFKTLYNFTNGADGGFLYGRLDIDAQGNLYGSTVDGGASNNGTVFKMSPTGTLTTMYDFAGGSDLSSPEGDMRLVGKKLYSTATTGGDPTCQCGGIYEVATKGKDKILHAFVGTDGSGYAAGLTLSNNIFYGTAQAGGNNENGVIYSVTK